MGSFSVYRTTLTTFFLFFGAVDDSFNHEEHKVDSIFNLHIKTSEINPTSEVEQDDKANTIDLFHNYVDLKTVAVADNLKTTIS